MISIFGVGLSARPSSPKCDGAWPGLSPLEGPKLGRFVGMERRRHIAPHIKPYRTAYRRPRCLPVPGQTTWMRRRRKRCVRDDAHGYVRVTDR